MAKGTREFEIKINGISKNVKDVTTLVEVLNKLVIVEKAVTKEINKSNKASKNRAEALSEEQKAQKKLAKAIDKVAQARIIDIQAQQEGNQTSQETQNITDATANSIKAMEVELASLKDEMNSVDRSSEAFTNLKQKVIELTTELGKAKSLTIETTVTLLEKKIGSLSKSIENTTNIGKGLASAFKMGGQVLNLFGFESEELTKTMGQIQKVLDLLSTTQAINTALLKNDIVAKTASFAIDKVRLIQDALRLKATELQTAAAGKATIAQRLLNAAANAFPALLIISAISAIAGVMASSTSKTKEYTSSVDGMTFATKEAADAHDDLLRKIRDVRLDIDVETGKISEYGATLIRVSNDNAKKLKEAEEAYKKDSVEFEKNAKNKIKWYHNQFDELKILAKTEEERKQREKEHNKKIEKLKEEGNNRIELENEKHNKKIADQNKQAQIDNLNGLDRDLVQIEVKRQKALEQAKLDNIQAWNDLLAGRKAFFVDINAINNKYNKEEESALEKDNKEKLAKTKELSDKKKELARLELELIRQSEDAKTELVTNEFDKREKITRLKYSRQKQDLQKRLDEDKTLTKAGQNAISEVIKSLSERETNDLKKINEDRIKSNATQIASAEKMTVTLKEGVEKRNKAINDAYNKQTALYQQFNNDEKEAVEKKYAELIAKANEAKKDTIELEIQKQKELNELKTSAIARDTDLQKEREDKIEASNNAFKQQELDDEKKWADLNLKEIDNKYRAIEDLRKKMEEDAKERKEKGQIIDVDATRKELEKATTDLEVYIKNVEDAKKELEKSHKERLRTLKEGTLEHKEATIQYANDEHALNQKIEKANKEKEKVSKESNELVLKYWQEMFSKISETANQVMDGINTVCKGIGSIFESQLEELNEKLDEVNERYDEVEKKREESTERIKNFEQQIQEAQGGSAIALREQLQREMQAKAELDQEEKRLAKEKEKREAEIAKKEKQKKKVDMMGNIVTATANVAEAITKMLTAGPFIGQAMAGVAAAMGAVQIATMTKQLSKMEKGGLLNGPSHANGGMRVQGTNIEVEGGEYVVNKRSTALNQPLIEYINNADRPVTARDLMNLQGIPVNNYSSRSTPNVQVRDTYTTEDKILEAIEGINFRPVVSVKDINTVQANIVDVTDIAGID